MNPAPQFSLTEDQKYVLDKLLQEREYHTDHPQAILVRFLFSAVLYGGSVLFAVAKADALCKDGCAAVVAALIVALVGFALTFIGIAMHTSQHLTKMREIEDAITRISVGDASFVDAIRNAAADSKETSVSAGLFCRQPDPSRRTLLKHDLYLCLGVALLVMASVVGILAYATRS